MAGISNQGPSQMDNVGLLLVGHGSELSSYKEAVEKLAALIRERSLFTVVRSGFMKINSPSIHDAISSAVKEGAEKLIVVPVFFAQSLHTTRDIPRILGMENRQTRGTLLVKAGDAVEVVYCEPIGVDTRLADIILDRAAEALKDLDKGKRVEFPDNPGAEIFEDSLNVVRQLLAKDLETMPRILVPILERVVHATADSEFTRLLTFSTDAVRAGVEALKRGADVIADVKMVESGINAEVIRAFGGRVLTYVDDERTISLASREGMTRTAASMRIAMEEGIDGDIIVIGNSPTAALTLADTVKRKLVRPALVIATPVGFVKAAESKDEISKLPVPSITVRGVKGGSAVAVAILNGLLAMAR